MATRTVDFKKLIIVVGPFHIKGFAAGTGVTLSRDEMAFEKKVGADGEVTRAKSNNRAGKATFVLDQASPSNDDLSSLALLDEVSGAGMVPVLVKDLLGTTVFSALAGWVQKIPDSQFAKKSEDRTWVIDCGEVDVFLGGNNS